MSSNVTDFCPILPPKITLDQFNGDYALYDDFLYENVFLEQLFNFKITFRGKFVELKSYPYFEGKEDIYFHLTCKNFDIDSEEREPDLRRSERLCWLRPAIETDHNKICKQDCFLIYERPYKKSNRIFLLDPVDRYFIVLEERPSYYLLITAFYIHYDNVLRKKLKEYDKYKTN